jgi:hypothetical protein
MIKILARLGHNGSNWDIRYRNKEGNKMKILEEKIMNIK